MSLRDILPAAVDYNDSHSLRELDEAHLIKLSSDCSAWCNWVESIRAGLHTPAGRTEWDVLMRHEHDEVAAAHSRIQDEIAARKAI